MDKQKVQEIAAILKRELDAVHAADTSGKEERIIGLLSAKNVQVRRRNLKSPLRYEVRRPNGRGMELVTLLDLERMCKKLGIDLG